MTTDTTDSTLVAESVNAQMLEALRAATGTHCGSALSIWPSTQKPGATHDL